MNRRRFLAAAAGGLVSPGLARGQSTSVPLIGFLNGFSRQEWADPIAAFHNGLGEVGYTEGTSCAIEYRWAESQSDRLAALAAELLTRPIDVLVATGGSVAALAAKKATAGVPIVFGIGADPVAIGLVESYSSPGGNATGVYFLTTELESKRLGLLRELVPNAALIAVLLNPKLGIAGPQRASIEKAAHEAKQAIHIEHATTDEEVDAAFERFAALKASAVLVGADPFFLTRRRKVVALAARYSMPAIYEQREFALDGGLVSYGTSLTDATRHVGVYTGRVLRGEKPATLPILRSTRLALVLNLKTAAALGLAIPPALLLSADEVIE
jgi:putative ABC transport system substrate-binding protein